MGASEDRKGAHYVEADQGRREHGANSYQAVIGLEVHAELLTAAKIFCGCSASFGAPPNTNVCPVCLGMPGSLPVLNRKVVELAVRAGLATGCRIARVSRWSRKNYFYPDLPKGYQISMYEMPLCTGGALEIVTEEGTRRVGLTRIHIEEDTGKNVHDPGGDWSLVDFNRCGVPLLEIVSEPDLRTPAEAAAYLRALRAILMYLEICDGNMEEGSFRCDANVSLRPAGSDRLGVKTEVKNMNSFRAVERALEYEIRRQAELLAAGEEVVQETRLWDPDRGQTRSMRSKEYAHDYRYFPEPDLPPLVVAPEWVEAVRRSLPELPAARRRRLAAQYGLSPYEADVLTSRKDLADFYEATVAAGAAASEAAAWVMTELLRVVRERKLDQELVIQQWPLTPAQLAAIASMVTAGEINRTTAKQVFNEVLDSAADPRALVAERGLGQVSDQAVLERTVNEVLAAHPAQVAEYRAGKQRVLGYLVGQVMKASGGRANPKLVNELVRRALSG